MANPDIFGRLRQFNKDFNKIFLNNFVDLYLHKFLKEN